MRNLYEIINHVNREFGHKGHLEYDQFDNNNIWFRILYPDTKIDKDETDSQYCYRSETPCQYGMCKVHIVYDKDNKPTFRIWKLKWIHAVYTNEYTMPDEKLRQQFDKASDILTKDCDLESYEECEQIYISNKLLKACIADCDKTIQSLKSFINQTTDLNKIKEKAECLINIIEFRQALQGIISCKTTDTERK